jgi:Mrp family chromosome partitioning ATPase
MSKNFELLHSISNEKELFETLDGWEDLPESAAEDAEASPQADEKKRERTPLETGLPDVFQAVSEALGPLDPFVPDLIGRPKPAREPIEGNGGGETGNTTFGERFPISRNPLARFSSVPVSSPWPELQIAPEPELGSDGEMPLEREALESTTGPEALPSTEKARISGSNCATLAEPLPVREEKTPWQAPQSPRASHPESPAGTRIAGSQSSGRAHARAVQARGVYKNARRELIAREEELKLVQRIFLGTEQDSPRIALFSALEREGGCAGICVRTGEILASQAGGSVCLVDADFRAPSLHEYFAVRNEKGLAEATLDSGPIQEFAQQLSPANLWLVPSGYGASQLNLNKAAEGLRARMEELRNAYRYVIIHSEPLWLNSNAMMFSKWTDGIVLILEADRTRRDTVRRIRESLAAANAKVLGVVLNNRSYPIPESVYSRL